MSNGAHSLIYISLTTVLKVLLVAAMGALITKKMPAKSLNGLSYLAIRCFLPSLLCSRLAVDLNWDLLYAGYYWAILFSIFPIIIGFVSSYYLLWLLLPPESQDLHSLLVLASTFQNALSFGLSIVTNISGLEWLTPEAVRECETVVFLYNIIASFMLCSAGVWIIRRGKEYDEQQAAKRLRAHRRLEQQKQLSALINADKEATNGTSANALVAAVATPTSAQSPTDSNEKQQKREAKRRKRRTTEKPSTSSSQPSERRKHRSRPGAGDNAEQQAAPSLHPSVSALYANLTNGGLDPLPAVAPPSLQPAAGASNNGPDAAAAEPASNLPSSDLGTAAAAAALEIAVSSSSSDSDVSVSSTSGSSDDREGSSEDSSSNSEEDIATQNEQEGLRYVGSGLFLNAAQPSDHHHLYSLLSTFMKPSKKAARRYYAAKGPAYNNNTAAATTVRTSASSAPPTDPLVLPTTASTMSNSPHRVQFQDALPPATQRWSAGGTAIRRYGTKPRSVFDLLAEKEAAERALARAAAAAPSIVTTGGLAGGTSSGDFSGSSGAPKTFNVYGEGNVVLATVTVPSRAAGLPQQPGGGGDDADVDERVEPSFLYDFLCPCFASRKTDANTTANVIGKKHKSSKRRRIHNKKAAAARSKLRRRAVALLGRVRLFFEESLSSVTVLATLLGVVIALTPPLKYIAHDTIIGTFVMGAMNIIGKATVPLTLLLLGTNVMAAESVSTALDANLREHQRRHQKLFYNVDGTAVAPPSTATTSSTTTASTSVVGGPPDAAPAAAEHEAPIDHDLFQTIRPQRKAGSGGGGGPRAVQLLTADDLEDGCVVSATPNQTYDDYFTAYQSQAALLAEQRAARVAAVCGGDVAAASTLEEQRLRAAVQAPTIVLNPPATTSPTAKKRTFVGVVKRVATSTASDRRAILNKIATVAKKKGDEAGRRAKAVFVERRRLWSVAAVRAWLRGLDIPTHFILMVMAVRLVVIPSLCLALFLFIEQQWSHWMPKTKGFRLTILVLTCAPTAINGAVLCCLIGYRYVAYTQALVFIYLGAAVTTTMWLSFYLWLVG